MANKRELKKTINYICDALFSDCIAIALYGGKTDKSNTDAVLKSIITIRENYVRRISHPEPGLKNRLYFNDLVEKFKVEANGVIDQINGMIEAGDE